MACPRCSAETRYVLNDERTEILGTRCTQCEWQQGAVLRTRPARPEEVGCYHCDNGLYCQLAGTDHGYRTLLEDDE